MYESVGLLCDVNSIGVCMVDLYLQFFFYSSIGENCRQVEDLIFYVYWCVYFLKFFVGEKSDEVVGIGCQCFIDDQGSIDVC